MQKWEYCLVNYNHGNVVICYLDANVPSGFREVVVEKLHGDVNKSMWKTYARLGEEGWEMFTDNGWFKRPKS